MNESPQIAPTPSPLPARPVSLVPLATLSVVVNPFVHLNHHGHPSVSVVHDPDGKTIGPHRRVGAEIKSEPVEIRSAVDVASMTGDFRPSRHHHWFEYSAEPVRITDNPQLRPYYAQHIRGGALLPADAKTAKVFGVAFREPSAVIVETATQAAKVWAADHDGALPQWAQGLDAAELHPSHAAHAKFLAAHVAKIPARAVPIAPPTQPATPRALADGDDHEGASQ